MNDREEWRERFRDIRAGGTTWWWWWWGWWYIYIYEGNGNESDSMKMYKDVKIRSFQWMIFPYRIEDLVFFISADFGQLARVFTNDPGYRGSIPVRVKLKTQKRYLILPFLTLSIIRHGSRQCWAILESSSALHYTSVLWLLSPLTIATIPRYNEGRPRLR